MKQIFWTTGILLLFPVAALVLPIAIRSWQVRTPAFHQGGIFKSDQIGERSTLGGLSYYLKNDLRSNRILVTYSTPEADGKYVDTVAKFHLPYREWIYELEYNRQEKTLTKRLFKEMPLPSEPTKVWGWHNITEQTLHQVAAPIRKMKTTFAIEAYKGGNLSELVVAKWGEFC